MSDRCPNCGVQAQHLIPSGGSAYFKCGNCKTPFRIGDPDDERTPIVGDVTDEAPGSATDA